MATKKVSRKKTSAKRAPLSEKQKRVLAKGQSLMKKAVALQKKSGVKSQHIYAGGKTQVVDVYKVNLKDALKKVKSTQRSLF